MEPKTGKDIIRPADDVTKIDFLKTKEFTPVGTIGDLLGCGLPPLEGLRSCGIYAITIPEGYNVSFISPDDAARKGNVLRPWPLDRLERKWVEAVDVVYYGLAGSRSFRSLAKRIRDLIRHGDGKTTDRGPHKGGEILWQLGGYEAFGIWILPTTPPPAPRNAEQKILEGFRQRCGKLPFANRQS